MDAAPAADGYRWPAEWEPHAATWLAWPHNPETWPGRLAEARAAFAVFVRELLRFEPVRLLVGGAAAEDAARHVLREAGAEIDSPRLGFRHVATDDSWLRDTGPIVLVRETPGGARGRLAVAFGFDAWGGKYPPWERDAAVAERIARLQGLPCREAGFVLEGGSIDGDGAGTLLTTEACLLASNRERGRTREGMQERLAAWLGAREVVWLRDGIAGDDTDGHVDDIARFTAPGCVVAVVEDDPSDANHAPLAENLRRLRASRDARGKPLSVATLPMPPPLEIDGQRCPASYANFYLANGGALVPTFGGSQDARALAVLRELLPDREVVGVPSAALVQGLGALHCLSQQEPV